MDGDTREQSPRQRLPNEKEIEINPAIKGDKTLELEFKDLLKIARAYTTDDNFAQILSDKTLNVMNKAGWIACCSAVDQFTQYKLPSQLGPAERIDLFIRVLLEQL